MNCRGLGQHKKRRDVFNYLKGTDADLFFLQDIHCNEEKRMSFRNDWGNDIFISSGTNNGRGVAILPNRKVQFDVIEEKQDEIGNAILVRAVINKVLEILIISIYGPNEDNPEFFKILTKMISDFTDNEESLPIIMCGDFNIALDQKIDTYNYDNENNVRAKKELRRLMTMHELKDSFREMNQGSKRYTWRKCNPTIKQARLDYILVSENICFEEYVLFRWDLYSVIYGLVVLQRRRTDIRLPRLAVYDINHTLNPINFG